MATAKKPTPRTSPFSTTNQTAAFNPPRASFSTTTPTRRTTTGTTSTFGNTWTPWVSKFPGTPGISSNHTPPAGVSPNQSRTVTVKKGDTLWDIAKRAPGGNSRAEIDARLRTIIAKNPALKNPDRIVAGQKIAY